MYFATTNELKFKEASAIVPDLEALDLSLAEIQSLCVEEVVRAKLEALSHVSLGQPVIVEDTGLEIASMEGLPGALVKWFLAALGADGLAQLAMTNGVAPEAEAVSAVGILYEGKTQIWLGRVSGRIVRPRGEDFGWISIFEHKASGVTFGEMSFAERLGVSMRREPLIQACRWIESQNV